jgi:hypothetical protein
MDHVRSGDPRVRVPPAVDLVVPDHRFVAAGVGVAGVVAAGVGVAGVVAAGVGVAGVGVARKEAAPSACSKRPDTTIAHQ